MTIDALITQSAHRLRERQIEEPISEAEFIIGTVLNFSRAKLQGGAGHEIDDVHLHVITEMIERRAQGEPMAYILGFRDFYKSRFKVGPGVLIPRPETEFIVEAALKCWPSANRDTQIVEFGAGSGCIGLSLLAERQRAQLIALEPSTEARRYCTLNSDQLGLATRINIKGATVEEWAPEPNFLADLVVANPPYIDVEDSEVEEMVRRYEPHEALFSDEAGLGAIKRWAIKASQVLRPGGFYIFEIGARQWPTVKEIVQLSFEGRNIQCLKDYAGFDRVVIVEKV